MGDVFSVFGSFEMFKLMHAQKVLRIEGIVCVLAAEGKLGRTNISVFGEAYYNSSNPAIYLICYLSRVYLHPTYLNPSTASSLEQQRKAREVPRGRSVIELRRYMDY